MVKFILPLLALPLGEGITQFVNARSFMGGALNTQKGIHLRNIANRHAGQLQIGIANPNPNLYSNQVHYLNASAPTGNDHYFGYWFENCDNLEVDNNIALSNTVPLGNGIDKRFRGFSVDNTTNSNFCSNKAEQMGSGVWVYNKCDGTNFRGTNNSGCLHGFHLLFATLPDQGNSATGESWDNKWTNRINTNDVVGNANFPFDWIWDTNNGIGSDWDPTNTAIGVTKVNGSSTDPQCAAAQGPREAERNEQFGAIVNDTTSYSDFPEEEKYLDKERFFKTMSDDSTLLTLGVASDSVYQSEFDSLSLTNIGTLKEAADALDAGNAMLAYAKANAVSAANNAEANKKTVFVILAEEIQTDSLLTANHKSVLHTVGVQNAIEGGEAVYIARAKLNEDIVDDPVGYYRYSSNQQQEQEKNAKKGKLYPNPATTGVIYSYKWSDEQTGQLSIYNTINLCVLVVKLSGKETAKQIDLSSFSQGVYFFRVHCNDDESDSGKIILMR